jgi:TPR repeat protein
MKELNSRPDEVAEAFFALCNSGYPKLPFGQGRESAERALQDQFSGAFSDLVKVADSGSPNVWYALGHAYSNGWGVAKNEKISTYWIYKAAECGHTDAMVRLANALTPHDSTEAEQQEALSWYRRAASLGNTGGMTWLGFAYREGTGVAVDYEEALRWFVKAYENGAAHAIEHIGSMYCAYMDPTAEAIDFFERIATTGDPESCFFLGILFGNNNASYYDQEKAMDWLIKAVHRKSRKSPRAMLELAWHCFEGCGTVRDIEGAKSWLDLFFKEPLERTEIHSEARELRRLIDEFEKQSLEEEV